VVDAIDQQDFDQILEITPIERNVIDVK